MLPVPGIADAAEWGIRVFGRIAAALLVLTLATSTVAGCGNEVQVRPTKAGRITMGFSQIGESSRWRAANTLSIKRSADIENIHLLFEVATVDREKQISHIRDFIQEKVDVIAFSPVVEDGWDDVLREAKAAGIPVIVTDRAIRTGDPSLYTASLGSNFVAEGSSAAVWMKSEFRSVAGPVRIVQLEGTPGSAPAIQRKAGFLEGIGGDPRFKIIESRNANFARADGQRVMTDLLRSHDDIDVVFAQNDDMGLGAVTAIEAAGKRPGKDIKVVTIDAIRDGLLALSQGKINYIAECNPLIGPQLMDLAKNIYLGIPVAKRVDTEETVFFPNTAKNGLKNREY